MARRYLAENLKKVRDTETYLLESRLRDRRVLKPEKIQESGFSKTRNTFFERNRQLQLELLGLHLLRCA
jgi:hypothetical protein